jgi:hypothetical protein
MSINLSRINLSRIVALCTLFSAACGRIDLDRPIAIDVAELQPDEPSNYRWVTKVAKSALTQAIEDMGGSVGEAERCMSVTTPDHICNPVLHVVLAGSAGECEDRLAYVAATDLNTIVVCPSMMTSLWTVNKVIRHEFGHVLGGGHISDEGSVMTPGAESSRPGRSSQALDFPYSALDISEICSHSWRSIGGVCGK